jgi:prepilin-type N-terminal cleavage/methylation domain-containing protein
VQRSSGTTSLVARSRSGFTLVELLVVIAILGTLIGLTLPAVQRSRETSRKLNCANNVSQLAKAMLHHESALQHFPSGGWGNTWLGVAERGSGVAQPGGWIYTLLPYLEQRPLFDSVEAASTGNIDTAYATLASTPLSVLNCPSRRSSNAIPLQVVSYRGDEGVSVTLREATRTDYAANGGSSANCPPLSRLLSSAGTAPQNARVTFCHRPPGNPANARTLTLPIQAIVNGHAQHDEDTLGDCAACDKGVPLVTNPTTLLEGDAWRQENAIEKMMRSDAGAPDFQDGFVHRMSRVVPAHIRDGLSNTYLVGEKYVMVDAYDAPVDEGDAEPMVAGYSGNTLRWGGLPPSPDAVGVSRPMAFGSAHADTFAMAFGDGRVQTMSFAIDPDVHRALSARADGGGVAPPTP